MLREVYSWKSSTADALGLAMQARKPGVLPELISLSEWTRAKQTHRGWWRHQNAYLFTRRQGQHSDVGVAKLLNCYPKAEDDPLLVQS